MRRLSTIVTSSLAMADYWYDRGDPKKADWYAKVASESEAEYEELKSSLSLKDLKVAYLEEARQAKRYKQEVVTIGDLGA